MTKQSLMSNGQCHQYQISNIYMNPCVATCGELSVGELSVGELLSNQAKSRLFGGKPLNL